VFKRSYRGGLLLKKKKGLKESVQMSNPTICLRLQIKNPKRRRILGRRIKYFEMAVFMPYGFENDGKSIGKE